MDAVSVPTGYNFDELANIFPMMTTEDHDLLTRDIKTHGLLNPIITHNGKILDGRNRLLACINANVEPRFEELPAGVDPKTFVVSANFTRRHLSESQRSIAAARLEIHTDRKHAAKQMKVTVASVTKANAVLKKGTPELIQAVDEDRMPISIAAKLSTMPEDAQRDAAKLKLKDLRGVVKTLTRAKKSASLARATQKASAQLGSKLYSVILADPPWKYEVWSTNGLDRAPENHYPTMDSAAIADMKVPSADNCALFLWATVPMLEQALNVLRMWGFTYKTNFVWVKDKAGLGHWNRNRHEIVLVGTKGNIPAPDPSMRDDSVIEADVREHSRKPDELHEMIEKYFPTLPRLEMFARRPRANWDCIGNELDEGIIRGQHDDAESAAAG